MRLQVLASAMALVAPSIAFTDSSPWVLFSTSSFDADRNGKTMALASDTLDDTRQILQNCPTEKYLLVNQRGMTTADFRRATSDRSLIPSLSRAIEDSRVKGKYLVSEVIGQSNEVIKVEDTGLPEYIRSQCSSRGGKYDVDILDLASLPLKDQETALARNHALLQDRIASVTADDSYTILFISTANEPVYEADFAEPIRVEYKRDMQGSNERRKDNETEWNKLPLFEKYQFFTPGIFMGLIATIVLVTILGVGVKALASLEVSYGAFEKDMGPSAQKKQQ